ncbi:MAG: phosphatidylglycerophosphatase A [Alphaproteobacteria bacterium]
MTKLARLIATFFGSGLLPKAPGTWGSLATLPVVYLVAYFFGKWGVLSFILFATAIGIWASNVYVRTTGKKDPGEVVIDEVAGQALALCIAPLDWRCYLVIFVLFRIFDILKPPPVSTLERLPEGWGIMLDDLMAGLYALVSFAILHQLMVGFHV